MHRAWEAVPYDMEIAKIAVVEFRAALDRFVRTGRTRGVRLMPDESESEYDRVEARVRRRLRG